MPGEVVLRLDAITKRFGAQVANDRISFALHAGEVVALLGENGAGKTTLMNVLFGHYVAEEGQVTVGGAPLPPGNPRAALAAGVTMVHQHFALADNLSVLENIVLGTRPLWRAGLGAGAARARVTALAARYELEVDLDAAVGTLTVGQCQRVEILKALFRDARILILDEPTAVLTPQEVAGLFATLRRAVADGTAVILITHKLPEVMAIADRILVLRHGRLVGDRDARGADRDEIVRMMVGAEVAAPRAAPAAAEGPELLALAGVSTPQAAGPGLRGVDLALRGGRIVGLAGVAGNGQAALAGLLSGTLRPAEGRMTVAGTPVGADWSPRRALRQGIGRIPEDRHRTGTVGAMSLAENAVLEAIGGSPFSRRGWIDRAAVRAFAAGIVRDYDVRGPGLDRPVRLLSGGNMQKLILGRALAPEPRVVLADQPTRGLDVGAVAYVHGRLLEARARGAAVLLISDDLDEVQALADEIRVIASGRLSPPFARGELSQAELGAWMTGQNFGAGHAA